MQGAVGFNTRYAFNCQYTNESSSEKKLVNWLRFDRIMVMSFWPTLYALVAISRGMWALKLCTIKILQFLTGGAG